MGPARIALSRSRKEMDTIMSAGTTSTIGAEPSAAKPPSAKTIQREYTQRDNGSLVVGVRLYCLNLAAQTLAAANGEGEMPRRGSVAEGGYHVGWTEVRQRVVDAAGVS